jgi:hypothetical protein
VWNLYGVFALWHGEEVLIMLMDQYIHCRIMMKLKKGGLLKKNCFCSGKDRHREEIAL